MVGIRQPELPDSSRMTSTGRLHSSHANLRRRTRKPTRYREDRVNRLGDRRKHLEKQVQEDTASIEDLEEKLKKQPECLDEKRERLTALNQEDAEALIAARSAAELHATAPD